MVPDRGDHGRRRAARAAAAAIGVVASLAIAFVAAAAVNAGAAHSGHVSRHGARKPVQSRRALDTQATRGKTTPARAPGAAGVAAAYRYPLNCLNVTLAAGDRDYALARLDRASPCWRYGVFDDAIFHRVGGVWRLVLDAPGYRCPMRSLPSVVQLGLGLCPSRDRQS